MRNFVEVACLVHDIGNPPFGHFGEKAIRDWFHHDPHRQSLFERLGAENVHLLEDFEKFDGNKQGLRILTRLQRNMGDEYGLNLTFTQLAASIKYPVPIKGGDKGSVFESERDIKDRIWRALELQKAERHHLALLMEAADDIAYCLSDIEDAHDKHLISSEDLDTAFGPGDRGRDDSRRITIGRARVTRDLVKTAAKEFLRRLRSPEMGRMDTTPLMDDRSGDLATLRDIANRQIYSSRIVLTNEVTAFKVITGMLDAFEPLLAMTDIDFRALAERFSAAQSIYEGKTSQIVAGLTAQPGHLALFPRKHLGVYLDCCAESNALEAFHRAHLIMDFIAGMTDEFALNTYRLLSGQRTNAATR